MTSETRLKSIPIIGETKSNFVGTITIPSSLPPQFIGDTPLICNSVTWQNTGNANGTCYMYIYEANFDGSEKQVTPLQSMSVILDPSAQTTGTNLYALIGLSQAYPADSTLYLCFKTWGEDESEPSCSGTVVSIGIS